MKTLTIRYDNEEELCQLLRTTLEKLPACENLQQGQGLVLRLSAISRGLPTVSTNVRDDVLDEPLGPRPISPTPTFGGRDLGEIGDFSDPRFIAAVAEERDRQLQDRFRTSLASQVRLDTDTIEDPFFGPNRYISEVTVQDAKGKTSVQRKVPVDLDLLGALKGEGNDSIFGDAVLGLSRGIASLLGLGDTTVSDALAKASGGDTRNVHVAIGLPVIEAIPGNALRDALMRESDQSLLEGNRESLQRSVSVGKLFTDILSKKAKAVLDRNAGNLEILRLQALEDE